MVASVDFEIAVPGQLSKAERMRSRYGGFSYEPDGGWEGGAAAEFSYDDLASSMNEIPTFSRGDTTNGAVIGFEPNGALVDIGVKSSAYCPLTEMELVKPNKPEEALDLGASYEFVIISREDENGQLTLSRRRLLFAQAWEKVTQLYAEDAIVQGEVAAVNRGGAMMLVEGLRAFLPGSLVDVRPVRDTAYLEEKELEFKIIKLDQKRNNVVVSRRAVVEKEFSEEREKLLETLKEGERVRGIVKNLTDYGAFLDLGARAFRAADLVELALALASATTIALREAVARPAGRGLGEPAAGRVPNLDVPRPGPPQQGTLELVAGMRDVPVVVDEDRRVVVASVRERRRRRRRVGGVVEAPC